MIETDAILGLIPVAKVKTALVLVTGGLAFEFMSEVAHEIERIAGHERFSDAIKRIENIADVQIDLVKSRIMDEGIWKGLFETTTQAGGCVPSLLLDSAADVIQLILGSSEAVAETIPVQDSNLNAKGLLEAVDVILEDAGLKEKAEQLVDQARKDIEIPIAPDPLLDAIYPDPYKDPIPDPVIPSPLDNPTYLPEEEPDLGKAYSHTTGLLMRIQTERGDVLARLVRQAIKSAKADGFEVKWSIPKIMRESSAHILNNTIRKSNKYYETYKPKFDGLQLEAKYSGFGTTRGSGKEFPIITLRLA